MTYPVIYRTCDRPKYTEITFPRLVEATSDDAHIIMIENSGDRDNWEQNKSTFEEYKDERCEIKIYKKRLGVTKPIIVGIDHFVKSHGEPKYVFNVDDDILVPEPINEGEYWDLLLAHMMDKGPWDVVGIASSDGFIRNVEGDGLACGSPYKFMAAGCAGFKYSIHKKDPLRDDKGIFSFNLWTEKYKCGWFAGYPLEKKDIDRYEKDISLRDTEYAEYTAHIQNKRGGQ